MRLLQISFLAIWPSLLPMRPAGAALPDFQEQAGKDPNTASQEGQAQAPLFNSEGVSRVIRIPVWAVGAVSGSGNIAGYCQVLSSLDKPEYFKVLDEANPLKNKGKPWEGAPERHILSVHSERFPLRVGILIEDAGEVRMAAQSLIHPAVEEILSTNKRPEDKYLVASYAEKLTFPEEAFNNSAFDLGGFFKSLHWKGKNPALRDSVSAMLDLMKAEQATVERILIVFSSGKHRRDPSKIDIEALKFKALRARTQILMVVVQDGDDPVSKSWDGIPIVQLTGGILYLINTRRLSPLCMGIPNCDSQQYRDASKKNLLELYVSRQQDVVVTYELDEQNLTPNSIRYVRIEVAKDHPGVKQLIKESRKVTRTNMDLIQLAFPQAYELGQ